MRGNPFLLKYHFLALNRARSALSLSMSGNQDFGDGRSRVYLQYMNQQFPSSRTVFSTMVDADCAHN